MLSSSCYCWSGTYSRIFKIYREMTTRGLAPYACSTETTVTPHPPPPPPRNEIKYSQNNASAPGSTSSKDMMVGGKW